MGLTEKVLWPSANRLSERTVIIFSSQVRKRMDGEILQAREMAKFRFFFLNCTKFLHWTSPGF